MGAPSRLGNPHPHVRASQQQRDRVCSPGPAFPHAALVVGLLVVELVVAGVPAPGGGCDHGPGLPRRVVTWACGDSDGHKALSVAQGWGWDRPAPQGSWHTCSGAPAFPANPINPSPVLRSSGRNPARQHRLREGVLAHRGQGKLVGMEGLTQYTQRQSQVNMPRMQLTPHYICFQFEGKCSWSIPHFSTKTV